MNGPAICLNNSKNKCLTDGQESINNKQIQVEFLESFANATKMNQSNGFVPGICRDPMIAASSKRCVILDISSVIKIIAAALTMNPFHFSVRNVLYIVFVFLFLFMCKNEKRETRSLGATLRHWELCVGCFGCLVGLPSRGEHTTNRVGRLLANASRTRDAA